MGFEWLLMTVLFWGTLALAVWAFVDALVRPADGYVAAGKLTKPAWVAITAIAGVLLYVMGGPLSFFGLPAVSPPSSTWSTSGRPCAACVAATAGSRSGPRVRRDGDPQHEVGDELRAREHAGDHERPAHHGRGHPEKTGDTGADPAEHLVVRVAGQPA